MPSRAYMQNLNDDCTKEQTTRGSSNKRNKEGSRHTINSRQAAETEHVMLIHRKHEDRRCGQLQQLTRVALARSLSATAKPLSISSWISCFLRVSPAWTHTVIIQWSTICALRLALCVAQGTNRCHCRMQAVFSGLSAMIAAANA